MAEGGKVMVDNADVTEVDIVCSHGIIRVIDLILPQSLSAQALCSQRLEPSFPAAFFVSGIVEPSRLRTWF